jgi:CheY-like chemotaxis protein
VTMVPDTQLLQNLRVLLVEDDRLTLEVYQTYLSMHGVNLKTANKVGDALKILGEWIPDIIVSDIGLPGEDGYSLIRRVRGELHLSKVYAIAITGYSDIGRAQEAGYQETLGKPLDPEQLLRRIQSFARTRKESP